jgi:hypothetical protein
MARRRCLSLIALPVMVASMLAAVAASASPLLRHAALHRSSAPAVRPGHPMIRPVSLQIQGMSDVLNKLADSTNWSGYALTGGDGAFRGVSASWIEPTATCKAGDGHRLAAFWVGLDGFTSRSVEQTGTDSDCRGATAVYYGWYEMFPAPTVTFRTEVRPGDHITASVTFHGPSTYVLVLRDLTRGWTQTITRKEGGLDRSSAELITEAPSTSGGVLPLADFGIVRFTGSEVNGTLLRDLAPIRILMIDGSGQLKDRTSPIGSADAFENRWLRSN